MPDRPRIPLAESCPERTALIEPAQIIQRLDVPIACVLTWFSDAAERWIDSAGGTLVVENRWEDGPHPLYELNHSGQRLGIMPMPVGAPMAAGVLEELIAFGCRSFIACGGAGALRQDLTVGHLVLVTSALRDEGTSHHYLVPGRTVDVHPGALQALRSTLAGHGVPLVEGRT